MMLEKSDGTGQRLEDLERRVRRLGGRIGVLNQLIADRLGLTGSDIAGLSLLADWGTLSAGDLGEAIGLTTGAMTRLIDRLERAGYVRRVPDPIDRRRVLVEPVADRIAAIENALASLRASTLELLRGLTDEGVATLSTLLDGYEQTVQREITSLASPSTTGGVRLLDLPPGAVGRLIFKSGAANVRITSDAAMADLYRVTFEGTPADVKSHDQTVVISYQSRSLFRSDGPRSTTVVVNSAIPWEIALQGGVARLSADLRDIELRALNLSGGVSQVNLNLPMSSAAVPIRLSGGVSQFRADRPGDVPIRLQMSGGASQVTVDGQRFGAVGGSLTWESPEAETRPIGYDVVLSGGASQLTIESRE